MATYYVDFATGTDTNNGTATTTPWQHCPGDANATSVPASTTLLAGDIVYFKRGSTYNGQITCGQSGSLKVSRSAAQITAAGVLTDVGATFQSSGVTTACYVYIYHSKTSVTDTWVESCGLFAVASVDSETQITLADFDGVAHSTAEMTYRISLVIIYKSVASWGSGKAIIDGQDTRDYGFNASSRSYLLFDALRFINMDYLGNEYQGAITGGAANVYVLNCEYEDILNSANNVGDYSVVKGCTSVNVLMMSVNAGSMRYTLIDGNSSDTATRTTFGGRFSIIRYNNYTNITGDGYGAHGDGIGFIDQGPSNDNEYGWIYGNTVDDSVEFIALYGGGGSGIPRYWVVHSNIFLGRYDTTGHGDAAILSMETSYIYVFNNVFIAVNPNNIGFLAMIRLQTEDVPQAQYWIIKNNIFYETTGSMIVLQSGCTTGHDIDHNHYYSGYAAPFLYVGAEKTWAQWAAYGYEASYGNNSTTDPLLTNATSDPPNVSLQSGSPCRGVGENLSSYFTLDHIGNVRSAWDIGAYEYTGGDPVDTPFSKDLAMILQ